MSTRLLVLGLISIAASATLRAQSGSLYRRSLTFVQSGPVSLRFDVAGPIAAGGQSSIALEFGADGSAAPLTVEPLPGTVTFVVSKGAQSATSFTTANAIAGTATPTGITDKTIRMDYTSVGRYLLSITHDADVAIGTTETWTLAMAGLPQIRGIASIEAGAFSSMVPAPAACGGGSSPCVCPTCPLRCPRLPCAGFRVIGIPEIVWPPVGPGPGPCPTGLSCPGPWRAEFDPASFDRIVATFIATPEQNEMIERTRDIRFDIEGGEPVGGVFEGRAGDFMQLIQYPKGKPASVSIRSGDSTLAQFRAEPATREPPSGLFKLGYGMIGLLAGVMVAILGMRLRSPGAPGGTLP